MLRLAQHHLETYQTCPRLFQHRYLEQLPPPPDPQGEGGRRWGVQVHQRIAQYLEGIAPIDRPDRLSETLRSLVAQVPDLQPQGGGERYPEHRRSLLFRHTIVLTAIYDLVVIDGDRTRLYDWKTYAHPAQPQKIERHWQTRLYLYLWCATTNQAPEQVSLTYWFLGGNGQPQAHAIPYDRPRHDQTQRDLATLLGDLERDYRAYQGGQTFAHPLPPGSPPCDHCERLQSDRRAIRWQRFAPETWGAIPEISPPDLPKPGNSNG